MHKEPQPIGTTVIVLNDQNQVLLGKRKNGYKAGLYGMPGGRLDRGEKSENGATRELKEETNLEALSLKYVGVVKEWQKENGFDFIHFFFICTKWKGQLSVLEPNKCEEWQWFDLDQLPENILPGHAAGIKIYQKKTQSNLMDI